MKFAFSTVSCPKWDFDTIAARAKEYGYDGVEVRAVGEREAERNTGRGRVTL